MNATKHVRRKIVAKDINVWAARVVEATTGIEIPDDLVEQEIRKIEEEKAMARSESSPLPFCQKRRPRLQFC